MNLTYLAAWSRFALVVALAAGCNEPKLVQEEDASSEADDGVSSGSRDADADARVTAPRSDGGSSRPNRPVGEPDVVRQGSDAQAPTPLRDAGEGSDTRDASISTMSEQDAGPVLITTDPSRGTCSLTGTYSVRGEMKVNWPGRSVGLYPLVNAGTGTAVVYARIEVDGTTEKMAARVALCGTEFPDFIAGDEAFFREHYGFYVADDVWDRDELPRWDVSWQRDCEVPSRGCRLQGLTLDATLGAIKWADPPAMLTSYDHDGDVHPGFTVRTRLPPQLSAGGDPYFPVPLSFVTSARSETLFAAMVVRARFEATLKDCDSFDGELAEPSIAIRSLGCLVRPRPNAEEVPCTSEHVRFLADNVPPVTAQLSTFEGRRIRDEVNCAAVRSVWKSDEP